MWQLSSICSRGACWRVDECSDDAPACRDPAEGAKPKGGFALKIHPHRALSRGQRLLSTTGCAWIAPGVWGI
jgi:hypothetical protein